MQQGPLDCIDNIDDTPCFQQDTIDAIHQTRDISSREKQILVAVSVLDEFVEFSHQTHHHTQQVFLYMTLLNRHRLGVLDNLRQSA